VLAIPPLPEAAALLDRNRRLLGRAAGDLLGRPLADLRAEARQAAVAAAWAYLREAGEPAPDGPAHSLILAGHQPELFHPGVWVKNFALTGLSAAGGATPLNLVVDNDTVKTNLLRVPAPCRAEDHAPTPLFHLESIPFDL